MYQPSNRVLGKKKLYLLVFELRYWLWALDKTMLRTLWLQSLSLSVQNWVLWAVWGTMLCFTPHHVSVLESSVQVVSAFLESFGKFDLVCKMKKNNRVELHLDFSRRPLLPRKSWCASLGRFVKLHTMTAHLCPACWRYKCHVLSIES